MLTAHFAAQAYGDEMGTVKVKSLVEPLFYTVSEMEEVLRLSHTKAAELIREKRVASIKLDGRRLIYRKSVHELAGVA
jgi:excisionase family DNA binding protein